jgi:hypothetical protein
MLVEFLHTYKSKEDGYTRVVVCGEKITINQMLIVQQIGINVKGVVDAVNALVKKAQVVINNTIGPDVFVNKE